jgi:hypothetical protein
MNLTLSANMTVSITSGQKASRQPSSGDLGPPFHRPERLTLQRAGREPETRAITLPGHGFTYEAEEVARCLRAGLTESPVLTLDDTLAVMRTLDAARADFGH